MTVPTIRMSLPPALRTPAVLALLAATVLAGCASRPHPQFSYDADVPPLPTAPAAITDDRPRPLHVPPAWTVARGGPEAGTDRKSVV